jgi:3(or 17)beta-hydroxysteroid dehydrogenase
MTRVKDKVALITGAASGLGAAAAQLLAAQGASVVLSDLNADDGAGIAAGIGDGALFLPHDVTSEELWQQVIDATLQTFGRLDILLNSAGIAVFKNIEETSLSEWRQVHAVNLDGVFLGCKYGVAAMKRNAGSGGSIINMSSVSGLVGGHNLAAYNSSKGAVRLLTKSVALHCARQGYNIRCNSIHPTFVDTPMLRRVIDASDDPGKTELALKRQVPLGRLGRVDDIANMVLYLASDESGFVTGAEMVIDGGVTAK